ncbi:MAG: hypothetical protein RR022_06130 [Angelakisella sp.]
MTKQPAGKQWSRLDNAAKIFPSNSTLRDPKVFRFSCQLTDEVDPAALQQALDKTLPAFPHYRSVLRRGLFWYFLEQSELPAVVEEEHLPLCSPLYDRDRRGLLFRVMYYRRRISAEVYHALSDGSGALQFLRTLLHHYLLIVHADELGDSPPALDYDASLWQKLDDSFARHYQGAPQREQHASAVSTAKRAYRLQGPKLSEYRLRLIEGSMPVEPLLALARSHGTTLTVLLGAVLVEAIHDCMPKRMEKLPVILSIPVNLRTYFESQSARNFFGLFYAGYSFDDGSSELNDIIAALGDCFRRELVPEQLALRMNKLAALERNLFTRFIPLVLKDITLRIFGRRTEHQMTAAFSNLGRITMPQPLAQYIETFAVCSSTNKIQLCLSTFNDRLTVTITEPFQHSGVPMRFFRRLNELGAQITVVSNIQEESR